MERKYFLHRIKHWESVSYPLLEEKSVLSIGWSDLANSTDFMAAYQADFRTEYEKNWEKWNRRANSLKKYMTEMNKGDWIVVPSWGVFHVYELVDDNLMTPADLDTKNLQNWHGHPISCNSGYLGCTDDNNQEYTIDLGFFRRVKIIQRDVNRNLYSSPSLVSMLKFRGTTNNISHLGNDVNDAIERKRKNSPVNAVKDIENDESITDKIYDILLKSLKPADLERLIQKYFEKCGASGVKQPPKNDREAGDADIVASFDNIKTVLYVQAKKHDDGTETNEWAVKQINDYKNRPSQSDNSTTSAAWVISTADTFSKKCVQLAEEHNIILVNGKEFAKMILQVGIAELD